MLVYDCATKSAPKDRVILVIDMTEDEPVWEFAAWCDWAYEDPAAFGLVVGAWCVGEHQLLRVAIMLDDLPDACSSHLDTITHWSEVPELPVVAQAA